MKSPTMKPLTDKEFDARHEAILSCIGHLNLDWTDDPEERRAGRWLQEQLKKIADKLLDLQTKNGKLKL